jgi:hypothetical protein
VRSPLSVDWVGSATLKRSPGVALLRLQRDLAGVKRLGSPSCAQVGSTSAARRTSTQAVRPKRASYARGTTARCVARRHAAA